MLKLKPECLRKRKGNENVIERLRIGRPPDDQPQLAAAQNNAFKGAFGIEDSGSLMSAPRLKSLCENPVFRVCGTAEEHGFIRAEEGPQWVRPLGPEGSVSRG
jgi:hypothetical protein